MFRVLSLFVDIWMTNITYRVALLLSTAAITTACSWDMIITPKKVLMVATFCICVHVPDLYYVL